MFWDWGIPTAISIVKFFQTVNVPVIASGGIRSGVDMAKALGLGASLTSLSQPILQVAAKNVEETEKTLLRLTEELRSAMFLVGAKSICELKEKPLVITGKTAEWLQLRGFNVENYAKRGV